MTFSSAFKTDLKFIVSSLLSVLAARAEDESERKSAR